MGSGFRNPDRATPDTSGFRKTKERNHGWEDAGRRGQKEKNRPQITSMNTDRKGKFLG